jgi:hypothetical protein
MAYSFVIHSVTKSQSVTLGNVKLFKFSHCCVPVVGTWGSCFLQATKALRESRGISLLCLDLDTRREMRGQRHAPAAFYPRKIPGTHCTGGWVGPRAGLGRCRNISPPTGMRSSDRPASSQSLYRLSYRAHCCL